MEKVKMMNEEAKEKTLATKQAQVSEYVVDKRVERMAQLTQDRAELKQKYLSLIPDADGEMRQEYKRLYDEYGRLIHLEAKRLAFDE